MVKKKKEEVFPVVMAFLNFIFNWNSIENSFSNNLISIEKPFVFNLNSIVKPLELNKKTIGFYLKLHWISIYLAKYANGHDHFNDVIN